MKTLNRVYNSIKCLNPKTNEISSVGEYTSNMSLQISDSKRAEILGVLTKDSLAYKIAYSANKFTDKQLWVIAYELVKNDEYCKVVNNFYDSLERKTTAKLNESKAKLSTNKENSKGVLDYIKSNGKKLADYYQFVKKNKKYAKEFYSKKFSMESANLFLNEN